MQHAKLSPSSASRWLTCTKSPEECYGLEETTSPYAEEGTKAHEMLEDWLKNGYDSQLSVLSTEIDMREAVTTAYKKIMELKDSDPGAIMISETTVGPNALGPDVWGTADVILYLPAFKTLYVIDYKHGMGVAVDLPSPQLEIYAILAMESFSWMFGEIEHVETMIIQPRAFHGDGPIRSHGYSPVELTTLAVFMNDSIATIGTDEAIYAPSESACRWCLAKSKCPALETKAQTAAQMTFAAIPKKEAAKEIPCDKLVEYHANRKLIDLWLKALDARILNGLMAGEEIGDLKVVAGRMGNRAWGADDDTVAETLKQNCKLKPKEIVTEKLKSPTQIAKLLQEKPERGKKKKLEALEALIARKTGKPTVVPGDDKRDSIVPQFKDLTQGDQ